MAKDVRSIPPQFGVDADFQAWVQAVHAQFAAMGFVQTSDTGQINPATVTKPVGTNTPQGYEIWRFTDSLQSTLPVYFKVEYGSGNPITISSMWMTVGTGSNGSGTLTGQVGVRRQMGLGNTSGAALSSYICSDGSGFALVTGYTPSSTSYGYLFIVERTRDGSGAATADGIYTFYGSGSGTLLQFWQMIPPSGTVPGGNANYGQGVGVSPGAWMTTVPFAPQYVGNNFPIVPIMCMCGKFCFLKLVHLVQASQVALQVPFSATVFGATHTLMPLAIASTGNPSGRAASSNQDALCLLWE